MSKVKQIYKKWFWPFDRADMVTADRASWKKPKRVILFYSGWDYKLLFPYLVRWFLLAWAFRLLVAVSDHIAYAPLRLALYSVAQTGVIVAVAMALLMLAIWARNKPRRRKKGEKQPPDFEEHA